MRIDDNNLSGLNPSATAASQNARAANQEGSTSAKAGNPDTSQDQVQLSSVANRVSAGNPSTDQSVSVERSARIEQLTKLVQNGQYHPDPERIADSMIRDMMPGAGSS